MVVRAIAVRPIADAKPMGIGNQSSPPIANALTAEIGWDAIAPGSVIIVNGEIILEHS